ncbi:hypothetical protein SAMN05443574_107119 [Haloarcula vallismortis]|uniref:Uncharacterized protein n=2 Tax=Haloarcula vallismortis TaxID=28442 RepID=M0JM64_HALVA|nr:hypothetical protein [Haloarcula vallismortis]EMA09438.1 hypothetical protein C437_06090 [Haloarcula vallismortis ATCC 29715]SDW82796.1 hypothetical protein SAMN05443574_107119 [Haloarcula vallismortis]
MRTKLFALYAAVGLALLAVGPGLAAAADSAGNTSAGNTLAVGISQADDGSATVSVTQNETGVENASVAVETAGNASYAGTGNYTADSNGTVGLPAPEQNVTVDVTATVDNHTATTTADLTVAPENVTEFDTFGLEVSAYVSDLLSDENRTGGIGPAVASFVTANNPGNAPDHAGPPAHVTGENESANETHPSERQGPPADIFGDDANETADENETDDRRGPPEDAGPPADRGPDRDDDDNETADENETDDDRRGPPEDAGPPADRDDDDSETETEDNETEESEDESGDADEQDDDDDSDDDDDDDDGDRGRPDDAGPPDDRGN